MRHSLIPQYREMHAHAHFAGLTAYAFASEIADVVLNSGAATLLDYGSGKGRQYVEGRIHGLWGGIMPTLYDPAVRGIDKRPEGQFDGVICTDVMEHVPEDEVRETLADIKQYARMWVFLSVCCKPATKSLPDGRNVHVTLHPPDWWIDLITREFRGGPEWHLRFEKPGKRIKPHTVRKVAKAERIRLGWQK